MMRRFVSAAVCCVALAACGGGDPTGPAAVATVEIAGATRPLASIGESFTLTPTGKSGKGKAVGGVSFTWSSANPSVATVSDGVVTAVGNGTTAITATVGSVTGTAQVTVQQVATQVVITFSSDTIKALGDTARAIATTRDARGAAIGPVTAQWTSSNPAVATVDGNGVLTAVTEGTTTVRGINASLQGEKTVTVRQRAARLVFTRQPAGARAGLAFDVQPIAEVQDSKGNRVNTDNTTAVTASVGAGGGTIAGASVATASGGVVSFVSVGVGGLVGTKSLLLSATGVESATSNTFSLAAGLASTVAIVGGNNQTGLAGVALPQPLQAGVRDAFGNGVASVPITFAIQDGGGTLSADVVTSNASGNASSTYTLSRFAGASTVRVTTAAAPAAQATFQATATPNGVIRGTVTGSAYVPGITTAATSAPRTALGGASHRQLRGAPVLQAFARNERKASLAENEPRLAATTAESPAQSDAPKYVPGELLVVYRAEAVDAPAKGASAATWRAAASDVASEIRSAVREVIPPSASETVATVLTVSPTVLTARLRLAPSAREADVMAQLRGDPRVASVERNSYVYTQEIRPTAMQHFFASRGIGEMPVATPFVAESSPFPTMVRDASTMSTYPFGGLFPGNALFLRQAWHYNVVALPQAWTLTQGSASVLVAVVDDGIRFDHPSMAGVLTNDGYDFVSASTYPRCSGGTIDQHGDGDGYDNNPTQPMDWATSGGCATAVSTSGNHGLHVAGTIGALRTGSAGLVGVNWNVRIRPVRGLGTTGQGSIYDVAQAILYAAGLPADNGAGGTVTAAGGPARVINMSFGGTGTSVVRANAVAAAVANGAVMVASAGNSNSSTPNYPASLPDVISVSAVAPTLLRASYSSFGSSVDITAPGGQVSTGSSHGVLSSTWNYVTNSSATDSWNGTSMSAPHVTGIVALLLAREPGLTPAQVSARLTSTALDIGLPGQDQEFGAGLINARNVLTNTLAPTRAMFVRVINANTGAVVRTVATASNGSYEVGGLPDGQYWVFAGHDEAGDGLTGLPWRSWGALGAASGPTTVIVNGAGVYPATFAITTGFEVEPNDAASNADELLVDGYVYGSISNTADLDVYRLRIPAQGTYVLQATGQVGACKFAVETDPIITVFSSAGAQLAEHDDLDFANNNFCAQLSLSLSPGDYFVRVGGFNSGRYALVARKQ